MKIRFSTPSTGTSLVVHRVCTVLSVTLKIGIQYVTQGKFSIFMHACQNLVSSIKKNGISQHLLQPLLVVLVSHRDTLPAPFRVAFALLLLFEPSWRAAHAHICRSRPLKPFTAFFGRCHCVGNKLKIAPQPAVRRRVPIGGNLRRQGLPCEST